MGKINDYFESCIFRKKTNKKLNKILLGMDFLTQEVSIMSMELDNLVRQVSETKDIEESVIVLLDGVKLQLETIIAELEEAQVDTTTLIQLHDDLDASEQALAAAVEAYNTPVEPPIEPPIEPPLEPEL